MLYFVLTGRRINSIEPGSVFNTCPANILARPVRAGPASEMTLFPPQNNHFLFVSNTLPLSSPLMA